MNKFSDEILMQKFQKGNKHAFEELYKRYSSRIYAYFMRLFNNDQQRAQDFTQDAFIKVIDKKLSFDTSRRFQPWLFTIATYMARSSFRDEKLTEDISDHEDLNSVEDIHDNNDIKRLVRNNLHILSYAQKSVFILRIYHELSVKEVADIMSCSEGTVKSRMYHATQNLAAQIKQIEAHGLDTNNTHYGKSI